METFIDRAQGLYQGIPDVMEIIEIVAVSSRSQADTERTVKTVKQVMRDRYQGKHDEHKTEQTVDRADEETFVCQNGDPNIVYFPGEEIYQEWIKTHKPVVMKTVSGPSGTGLA